MPLNLGQYIDEVKLRRRDVTDFNRYPFSLPAIRNLNSITLHPAVTFIVGENGSGKSTLLEAIAVGYGFNPEGGSKNFNFNNRSSHSDLHQYLRLPRGARRPRDGYFLRAESFFNVATEIERLDSEPGTGPPIAPAYGQRQLHEQSHGESFMALLQNRFRGEGLYILDEPEAALSPQRQLAALARIHELTAKQSQFIIATHSPIIMAYPNAVIYHCGNDGITRIRYEDTEHYRVTKAFLDDPARTLATFLNA
jgi:predicted ATPase